MGRMKAYSNLARAFRLPRFSSEAPDWAGCRIPRSTFRIFRSGLNIANTSLATHPNRTGDRRFPVRANDQQCDNIVQTRRSGISDSVNLHCYLCFQGNGPRFWYILKNPLPLE